jgi:hypothetical protein
MVCGTTNPIGATIAYLHGMGTVVRCPICDNALIRVAHIKERYWLEMRGRACPSGQCGRIALLKRQHLPGARHGRHPLSAGTVRNHPISASLHCPADGRLWVQDGE